MRRLRKGKQQITRKTRRSGADHGTERSRIGRMDAQQAAVATSENDALLNLEERILRAVQLVTSLRSEKQSHLSEKSQLLAETQARESEVSSARQQVAQTQRELE